jgi:hypothetical protein
VDNLGRPVADLLRQMPGVAEVQVVPADGKPTRRLIHLRDWHLVPRDLVARELRGSSARAVAAEEIDQPQGVRQAARGEGVRHEEAQRNLFSLR